MSYGNGARCPFPVAIASYAAAVLVIPVASFLLGSTLSLTWRYILLLSGVAGCALFLEWRLRVGDECPWFQTSAFGRLGIYGILLFIGMLVFLPITTADVSLVPIWSGLAALAVIPTVALLVVHRRVDHGVFEEVGVPRWLVVTSRFPLYLLLFLGLIALLIAGISMIYDVAAR